MKKVLTVLFVLLLTLSLAACQTNGSNGGGEDEKKVYKVGIVAKDFSDAFTGWQAKLMKEKADNNYADFEATIVDCEGQIANEISKVETFLESGYDVILWQCSDEEAGVEVANKCHEAGVYLITLSNVCNDDYSYAIKSDQIQEGQAIGEYCYKYLPENANVIICRAPDGSNYGNKRTKGFTMECLDKRPDVTLLIEKPADWDRAKAMANMEDWLTAYDKIDAVICHNDSMALGCADAIEAAGKTGEIMVFGIDGLPEGCWYVSQGKLTGTVIQDAITQSDKALELAHHLVTTGEPTDDVVDRMIVIKGELVCEEYGNIDKWVEIHKESGNWQY